MDVPTDRLPSSVLSFAKKSNGFTTLNDTLEEESVEKCLKFSC